ncbi:hypothetical protein V3C99_015865 [Haemonchus contortus]
MAPDSFRQRYEGLFIYSIYSPQDDKVGYRTACGELASSITGADQEFQACSFYTGFLFVDGRSQDTGEASGPPLSALHGG